MFADRLVTEEAEVGLLGLARVARPLLGGWRGPGKLSLATTGHCSCLSSLPIQHSLLEFHDTSLSDHNFAHLIR